MSTDVAEDGNGRNGSKERKADRPYGWPWFTAPQRLIPALGFIICAVWVANSAWKDYTHKTDANESDIMSIKGEVAQHTQQLNRIEKIITRIATKTWPNEKWSDAGNGNP